MGFGCLRSLLAVPSASLSHMFKDTSSPLSAAEPMTKVDYVARMTTRVLNRHFSTPPALRFEQTPQGRRHSGPAGGLRFSWCCVVIHEEAANGSN